MNAQLTLFTAILFTSIINRVSGNGRLLVPPQRSSLWRDTQNQRNPKVLKNYNDHTLNCGGSWKREIYGGKCGVCGDPWDAKEPRPNEAGGIFGSGVIGRTYSPDEGYIDAEVQVTSSIGGYFEFNICPNNDIHSRVSHKCLDNFPMRILSENRTISYGRRYYPKVTPGRSGFVQLALEIPQGLECFQCVLRWRWHGGNNFGLCTNGKWGKGCGTQSEIYNCADIAILHEDENDDKISTTTYTTTKATTAVKPETNEAATTRRVESTSAATTTTAATILVQPTTAAAAAATTTVELTTATRTTATFEPTSAAKTTQADLTMAATTTVEQTKTASTTKSESTPTTATTTIEPIMETATTTVETITELATNTPTVKQATEYITTSAYTMTESTITSESPTKSATTTDQVTVPETTMEINPGVNQPAVTPDNVATKKPLVNGSVIPESSTTSSSSEISTNSE